MNSDKVYQVLQVYLFHFQPTYQTLLHRYARFLVYNGSTKVMDMLAVTQIITEIPSSTLSTSLMSLNPGTLLQVGLL